MGDYDFYISLIMRFPAWTPDVIDSMDPDFIEELTARLEAENKYEQKLRKRSKK